MGRGKNWRKEDVGFLIGNYGQKTSKEISKIINRSEDCIRQKAHQLKIKRDKNWSYEDIKFLMNNYQSNGLTYCSDKLNKTKHSVQRKAMRMNLCDKANGKWSEEEVEILKKNYPVGGTDSCKLNRNSRAINAKARKLKINRECFTTETVKNRLLNGVINFECKKHGKVDFCIKQNKHMTPQCKLCRQIQSKKDYDKKSKSLLFKYENRIRSLIKYGLKRVSNGNSIIKGCFRYLDYSPTELFDHLEKIRKNQNNCCPMCNISYDIKPFDIDHVIPTRIAKTTEELLKLFLLNNLSLLCYYCNRYVKGGKYNG